MAAAVINKHIRQSLLLLQMKMKDVTGRRNRFSLEIRDKAVLTVFD
jgi:hypothetical protein